MHVLHSCLIKAVPQMFYIFLLSVSEPLCMGYTVIYFFCVDYSSMSLVLQPFPIQQALFLYMLFYTSFFVVDSILPAVYTEAS